MITRENFIASFGIVGTVTSSSALAAGSLVISILCGICTLIVTAPLAWKTLRSLGKK